MYRQLLHLAFDIPQRQIERADRADLLAARRIEERARHILPEALDKLRIAADQTARRSASTYRATRLRRYP